MGDTGSLLIGLVCAILAIKFIESHNALAQDHRWAFKAVPVVAIGIMILPLFDTLRVFTMRALRGKSPFSPDRTHIHHLLIDAGLTHMQATGVLVVVNIFFIIIVFALQDIGSINLLLLIIALAVGLTAVLYFTVNRKKLNQQTS